MRYVVLVALCLAGAVLPAAAEPACPGNPDAIGPSRTITVDPSVLSRIGSMQYKTTLPLADHEVAITFDDGPLPPYTDRILKVLADNCVKATYFLVGQMARAYPQQVRRIYEAGHTIGTHSQHHPFHFDSMGLPRIESEVDDGIASVEAALGDPRAISPFFRIPGLARGRQVESYLASQSIAVWSADEVADDWFRHITPDQIVRRAIRRIEAHDHRGVLLLHDIHPATAMALPTLLKELKERGYHIVQPVAPGVRPKLPERPAPLVAEKEGWPRLLKTSAVAEQRPLKKNKHLRKHLARNERDPVVSAAIAKKKRKPHSAQATSRTSSAVVR
jgi:peptidoglycan/xylan/chitin deacetylase (PgdA/CDA1 family)